MLCQREGRECEVVVDFRIGPGQMQGSQGPVEGTAANSAAQRAKKATPALQQQLHSLSHRRTSTVFGWGGQNLN